jgi:hypothetical protein
MNLSFYAVNIRMAPAQSSIKLCQAWCRFRRSIHRFRRPSVANDSLTQNIDSFAPTHSAIRPARLCRARPRGSIPGWKNGSLRWALPLPANCSLLFTRIAAIISGSLARDRPAAENARVMKKVQNKSGRKRKPNEYDFSQGERGKYARRYAQGTNVVVLEPDVAKVFPNSKVVNVLLRGIIRQQARELVK